MRGLSLGVSRCGKNKAEIPTTGNIIGDSLLGVRPMEKSKESSDPGPGKNIEIHTNSEKVIDAI